MTIFADEIRSKEIRSILEEYDCRLFERIDEDYESTGELIVKALLWYVNKEIREHEETRNL